MNNKVYDSSRKEAVQERNKLSRKQKLLYNEAMYGLKTYSPKQLYNLSEKEKKQIHQRHVSAQYHLNIWKQEMIIGYSDYILKKTNVHSKIINLFKTNSEPIPKWNCSMTFNEMNVTRSMIIKRLIQAEVLPENFEVL